MRILGQPFFKKASTYGCALIVIFAFGRDCRMKLISLSISSMISIDAFIFPLPSQVGQTSAVSILTAGLTRWRVIWINPNLLKGKTVCWARSCFMNSRICVCRIFLCSLSRMSIKSITIKPPISLSLSCLAISLADSRFTLRMAWPWLSLGILCPLLTSITCIASVDSITK